jgi:hypothetical protein
MIIEIPKRLVIHPNKYLFDGSHYDFLGAILLFNGISIPEKCKFPSEMKILIPYYTYKLRGKIVDTPLTISILQFDSHPQKEALVGINRLLFPLSIELKIV